MRTDRLRKRHYKRTFRLLAPSSPPSCSSAGARRRPNCAPASDETLRTGRTGQCATITPRRWRRARARKRRHAAAPAPPLPPSSSSSLSSGRPARRELDRSEGCLLACSATAPAWRWIASCKCWLQLARLGANSSIGSFLNCKHDRPLKCICYPATI